MPKPIRKTPELRWDKQANRYRASNGQFVARSAVVDSVQSVVDDTRRKVQALSQAYADGKITLLDWQIGMKDTLKAAHTLSAGIAMGGKANMTPADWGRVGQMIRVQYEALNRFALELEQGKSMHLGRADQYAKAVRMTFINAERLNRPFQQLARWVRTKHESCAGCLEQAARGVQLLAAFPAIGSQQCRMNCGCHLAFVTEAA